MLEKDKIIKSVEDKNECCPACTSNEICKTYNTDEKNFKWSKDCCEKCVDVTCLQNPFYIISLSQNNKNEKKYIDNIIFKDYYEEALKTILSF